MTNDDPTASPDDQILTEENVFRILREWGVTEEDREGNKHPPGATAGLVFMALTTAPTEDQLLDVMTWGFRDRALWDRLRPLARRLLALTDE